MSSDEKISASQGILRFAMANILVTGGAGYIGSHTCVELIKCGHKVIVYDNFCNSNPNIVLKLEKICSQSFSVVNADIRDFNKLKSVLIDFNCDSVIHFAALKSVIESVNHPLKYYDNNVVGALSLINAMISVGIKKLIFSSSATVYGEPKFLPITEDHPLSATNAYGHTKLVIEDVLRNVFKSDPGWEIMMLRYFNPVGAHETGLIGENLYCSPNNLMPVIIDVARGYRDYLDVFGGDYPTKDGTGIRDYIHVVDLALGHVKALEYLSYPQCTAINLGTGIPYSVLEIVAAFENETAIKIPIRIKNRRVGDVHTCYASTKNAEDMLGWKATRGLNLMCCDAWRAALIQQKEVNFLPSPG